MDIGSTIRTIRKRKKITISQLCEGTGLSPGFMSQLENNKTSPSISTLENIADFLKVPLPYLLLKKNQRMQVVKQGERKQTTAGKGALVVEHLASKGALRTMLVELPPGASTGDAPTAHEGEECHLILQGRILAEQGEESFILEAGDSFSWTSSVPHYVKNIGDVPALVLISQYSEGD